MGRNTSIIIKGNPPQIPTTLPIQIKLHASSSNQQLKRVQIPLKHQISLIIKCSRHNPSENNKWRRGKFLEFKPNEWIGKFGLEQVKINSFSTLTESKVSTGLGNIAPRDSKWFVEAVQGDSTIRNDSNWFLRRVTDNKNRRLKNVQWNYFEKLIRFVGLQMRQVDSSRWPVNGKRIDSQKMTSNPLWLWGFHWSWRKKLNCPSEVKAETPEISCFKLRELENSFKFPSGNKMWIVPLCETKTLESELNRLEFPWKDSRHLIVKVSFRSGKLEGSVYHWNWRKIA